jgi:N,N'-diacetyllegionaminate synthase
MNLLKDFMLIAEIGGNHEGSFEKAKKYADLAIEAGANIVKYQIYTGSTLVSTQEDPARAAHFDKFALTKDQYKELAEYIIEKGAIFNASIWTEEWIEEFDKYLTFYKIGSGDLTAYPIIAKIIKKNKPIILSTGLSTLDEVRDCVNFIIGKNDIYKQPTMLGILQCTSMYPIPDEEANLAVLDLYRREFPNAKIGYSDHTVGNEAVKLAIARGAEIIEIHFSDNNKNSSFRDHLVSLEPHDVKEIINYKKKINSLLGSDTKQPTKSELETRHIHSFRRGLYLNKKKYAGESIKYEDLIALRPNHGIDARNYEELIGLKLKRDIELHEKLDFSYFQKK